MNPEGAEGGSKLQVPIEVAFFMTSFPNSRSTEECDYIRHYGTAQLRFTRSGSWATYCMCVKKCLMPFDSKSPKNLLSY